MRVILNIYLLKIMQYILLNNYFKQPKVYRHRTNILTQYTDHQLIETYRFDKATIQHIVNLISEDITSITGKSKALTAEQKVLIALKFFATGNSFRQIAETIGATKSSVSRSIREVSATLCSHSKEFIKFPTEIDEIKTIKKKFYDIAHFPEVIGAIDGTHIPILKPSTNDYIYINRKGYASINCQIVVDSDLVIRNLVCKYPGSSHDAYILRSSKLFTNFESKNDSSILLGDSGYPLQNWLFTPFLNPLSEAEESYNYSHIRTRNTVERAIGVWKSRFRCISLIGGPLRFPPQTCPQIILATAILHNIARTLNKQPDPINDLIDEQLDPQFENYDEQNENNDARELRSLFADAHFSSER